MAERKVARPLPPVAVTVELPAHLAADLDALAQAWQATPSDVVSIALARLLARAQRPHDGQRAGDTPEVRSGHLPPDPHLSRAPRRRP